MSDDRAKCLALGPAAASRVSNAGTANLKGLAGQTQINASRVQHALAIHVAKDNDEGTFLDLVHFSRFSHIGPFCRAVVGDFAEVFGPCVNAAADVHLRQVFVDSDDVSLPFCFFLRSGCRFGFRRGLFRTQGHGGKECTCENNGKQIPVKLPCVLQFDKHRVSTDCKGRIR